MSENKKRTAGRNFTKGVRKADGPKRGGAPEWKKDSAKRGGAPERKNDGAKRGDYQDKWEDEKRSSYRGPKSDEKRSSYRGPKSDEKRSSYRGTREDEKRGKSGVRNRRDGEPEKKRVKKVSTPGNCALSRDCGGCTMQGIAYEKQLKMKQNQVQELLASFCKVNTITGMEDPFHYRNKVHAVFGRLRNGTYISGVYEAGSHRIVNVDECQIEDQKADAIIRDIRGLLKSFKIRTYDEDTGYGLLRHVLIRRGFKSGEIMVVLVLSSPILPSKNNFVKALRALQPEISTVVINVNDRNTSMVLGDKEHVIYGKGFIEDTLCDTVFRISPKSFYQVNPVQTEHP